MDSILRLVPRSRSRSCALGSIRAIATPSVVPSKIYVSDSTDPFFNLAFEDWLFRKTDPEQIILYLYRNTPSVIIGRNQNPWKEINLPRLGELSIPFVRRKSGGGAVYHDLGNTNYCVIVPRLTFERRTNATMVAQALNELYVPAYVNERNDICVDSFKIRGADEYRGYVSGSAFKLVNARAYHHGTMLIDAKLGDLKGLLSTNKDTLIAKGVASFPSPVQNLVHWNAGISHEDFVRVVAEKFAETYKGDGVVQRIDEGALETNDYVRGVTEELKSWEWMYGQTPEFTHEISGSFSGSTLTIDMKSRHALIETVSISTTSAEVREVQEEVKECLVGDRYGSLEKLHELGRTKEGIPKRTLENLLSWLKDRM